MDLKSKGEMRLPQSKQSEWYEQWRMFRDAELFLFKDWIYPNTLDDFIDKEILECGCGGGQHTSFMAPYAKRLTAVDLNTIAIASEINRDYDHVEFIESDIASMDLKKKFDVVISIGVVHHTNDPDETVRNMIRHLKVGGKLILWVYSEEGNFLVKHVVEPMRKMFLRNRNRTDLIHISRIITAGMYIPVYSLYLLPLRFLPYYQYFGNFRKLSFDRNMLNVYDKLNAPQVEFISRSRIMSWFGDSFEKVHVSSYKDVSWRCSGVMRRSKGYHVQSPAD